MSALATVCGFYCAMVALIGIYFFIILGVMELKGNTFLLQILQLNPAEAEKDKPDEFETKEQWSTNDKATAFFITAGIQLVFVIGCYWCGYSSMKNDELAEKKRLEEASHPAIRE